MLTSCPRCHSHLNQVIGDNAICSCGWTGSLSNKKKSRFSFLNKKPKSGYKSKGMSKSSMMNFGFFALAVAGFSYGYSEWNSNLFARAAYVAKSTVQLNSSSDEFRMAVICHKLGKLDCKVMALAKAYKKDPQNVELTGEYAISLTESGKHDQAILAFQKYFSQSQGTWRQKYFFAQSLGEKEFYTDAKEYFYKAINENPDNLQIPEAMMEMLTKANLYGEALSIIGHFNLSLPKTQKIWHNLTLKIKGQYKDYQAKFAIKEMTLSKLGNHFFAPAIFAGAMDMQLFIVNPESTYTTVDMAYLRNNGIAFEDKGKIEVQATNGNGQAISGTKVIIPELLFGAWTLKNVSAIACDNCAFVAGKGILGQLSVATSQVPNTTVNLLSMKEK